MGFPYLHRLGHGSRTRHRRQSVCNCICSCFQSGNLIADPIINCVVGEIFLVSKSQQDCGVWVWEGGRVFRDNEKVSPALYITISRAISEHAGFVA